MSMTCEATVRLSATPPALSDMRKHVTVGSVLNAAMVLLRLSSDMLPSSFTHLMPTCSALCYRP